LGKKGNRLIQDLIIEKLKLAFQGKESFSRRELFDFFLQFEPNLKENTFRWWIYSLKKRNQISPISRRQFTLVYKPLFQPSIGEDERKVASLIQKQFKEIKLAVWSTRLISEFMLHQPVRSLIIVEVVKDAIEPVFYFLKDNQIKNVFLEPDKKDIEKYISGLEKAIAVLPLISKAPIQKMGNTNTITIEKLLVDLFSNKQLFTPYQGNELVHIYNNAYSRYAIDFTKLFSYAGRRKKAEELKDFLLQRTEIDKYALTFLKNPE
jgi:hypothetical protein